MTGLLTFVLLETEPLIDPNVAKPGWTPLLITGLLLLALAFLFFSMRKQIRKIQIPRSNSEGTGSEGTGSERTGSEGGSTAVEDRTPPEKATRPDPR
jgi:hypothetical protein